MAQTSYSMNNLDLQSCEHRSTDFTGNFKKKKVGEKKRSCRVSLGLFRANSLGLSPFPKDKLTRGGGDYLYKDVWYCREWQLLYLLERQNEQV